MGKFCGVFPAVPGDDLIAAFRARAGNQWGQHTVLLHTLHRTLHGFIIQHFEWMIRERVQFRNGDLLHLFPPLLLPGFLGRKNVICTF